MQYIPFFHIRLEFSQPSYKVVLSQICHKFILTSLLYIYTCLTDFASHNFVFKKTSDEDNFCLKTPCKRSIFSITTPVDCCLMLGMVIFQKFCIDESSVSQSLSLYIAKFVLFDHVVLLWNKELWRVTSYSQAVHIACTHTFKFYIYFRDDFWKWITNMLVTLSVTCLVIWSKDHSKISFLNGSVSWSMVDSILTCLPFFSYRKQLHPITHTQRFRLQFTT